MAGHQQHVVPLTARFHPATTIHTAVYTTTFANSVANTTTIHTAVNAKNMRNKQAEVDAAVPLDRWGRKKRDFNREAKRIVKEFCTEDTPAKVRDLISFVVNRDELPVGRRRSYADSTAKPPELKKLKPGAVKRAASAIDDDFPPSIFKESAYLGGGAEGYVFRHTEGPYRLKRILKVREMTTTAGVYSLAREVLNGLFVAASAVELRTPPVPFIAQLIDWHLWNGYLATSADKRYDTSVVQEINKRLGRDITHPDYAIDFSQLLPNSNMRRTIYDLWMRLMTPEQRAILYAEKEMRTASLEAQYAASRAHFLATRPQVYATLSQQYVGETTLTEKLNLTARVLEEGTATSWTSPEHWNTISSHCIVALHQLYTLQVRYGFMHLDLNSSNITLALVQELTERFTNMYRPTPSSPGSERGSFHTRNLTLADMGGYVPSIIDLSQASFDRKTLSERLFLRDADLRDGMAAGWAKILIGRNHAYSRETDLRRLGLYFAFPIMRNFRLIQDHMRKTSAVSGIPYYDALFDQLVKHIDWRFVRLAMNMVAVPKRWLDLVRLNPNAIAQRQVINENFPAPRAKNLEQFVANLIRLQIFLNQLLRVVIPANKVRMSATGDLRAVLVNLINTQEATVAVVNDITHDLNPMTHFILEDAKCVELASDPLLPENMIRWSIFVQE